MTRRIWAVAVLALIGTAIAIHLTIHYYDVHSGMVGFKSFCNISQKMNCDAIAASSYAQLFPGFPLSSFVAGWFAALFFVALFARNAFWRRDSLRVALFLSGFGTAASLYYLFIMAGVLNTFCLFCLVVDGINLAALGLVLSMKSEWKSPHKMEIDKLKVLGGITAASLVAMVLVLKSFDKINAPSGMIDEMIQKTVQSAALPVGSGPEYPSIGPSNAPVTIVEFSDFQCPYCKMGATLLNSVMYRHAGQIRVIFRNFPLDPNCNRLVKNMVHPVACEAARVAYCAHQQGKFEDVYQAIFENQASLSPGKPAELARAAGLDPQKLDACIKSEQTQLAITKDIEEGDRLGVQSTPTFFINGRKMEGMIPIPGWSKLIEKITHDR